ncbi:MAG: DUF481 domain-containing protein [Candidatus Nitrotoga sp.]
MKIFASLLFPVVIGIWGNALADDAKPDGKWRGSGGAALSISSGNTRSSSINLTADASRETLDGKLTLFGQALGSRAETNGITSTSANQWRASTRYDHNISPRVFGFGGLDFSHDQIKKLSLRSVVSSGLGYHLIKTDDHQLDFFSGASYKSDLYSGSGLFIDNQLRTSFKAFELLLGEESTHKFSDITSLNQRLVIYQNMTGSGGNRATFNTSLLVALNKTLSLSVTLQNRYDSLVPAGIKKNDILFFTGINVKFSE